MLDAELAQVAKATGHGVAITDAAGQLVWVNDGWERLTGYTLDEVVGRVPGHFLQGPGTDPDTVAYIRGQIAAGEGFRVDLLNYRKDGTPYWLNLEVQVVRGADGAIDRFIALEYDITARKNAEERLEAARQEAELFAEALAYSRQQMEQILHGANLGEWIWDLDDGSLVVNDEWLDSLGMEFEHDRDLNRVLEGIHPDDREQVVAAGRRQALSRNEALDIEFRMRDQRGHQKWILARGRAVDFDEQGRPRRLMGTMLDVSDRKQAEEELRAERSLMRNILSTIPHGVYWKDEKGHFSGCNQTFAGLMGLASPEAVRDIGGEDLVDGDFSAMSHARDMQVLSSGIPILDTEESFTDAGGVRRDVMSSRVPLRDADGAPQGILGVFTDITATRQLESQLAAATRLEAIGQLAAGIAHEINTPMQYIGDNTQFLAKAFERIESVIAAVEGLQATKPEEAARAVAELSDLMARLKVSFLRERIPRAIEHSLEGVTAVSRIVRAMKDFSHPGAETMERVDLNAAIETTLTVCKNEWKYVATVDLDLDQTLPLVPCLPGEINQVLLNVIVNAAHAIRDHRQADGTGTIKIATRTARRDVVVSVTDDGGGIPDDIIDRIFDPFFTTKPVGHGTGQGLAISHQIIVGRHGGSIDVRTEHGVGTTFDIVLPLHQDNSEGNV